MPGQVISDDGLIRRATAIVASYNATNLHVHLYKNNLTPDRDTVLGDFTECDFDGYAAANIGATWSLGVLAAHVQEFDPAGVLFTKSVGATPNDVYGYFVTNFDDTVLLWSERIADPDPLTMSLPGQTLAVTALQTDKSTLP